VWSRHILPHLTTSGNLTVHSRPIRQPRAIPPCTEESQGKFLTTVHPHLWFIHRKITRIYWGPQAKACTKLREISSDAISLLASTFRFRLPLFRINVEVSIHWGTACVRKTVFSRAHNYWTHVIEKMIDADSESTWWGLRRNLIGISRFAETYDLLPDRRELMGHPQDLTNTWIESPATGLSFPVSGKFRGWPIKKISVLKVGLFYDKSSLRRPCLYMIKDINAFNFEDEWSFTTWMRMNGLS
jgi:hypothetical protein